MRIHHLNCISARPLGGRLVDGRARGALRGAHLACHCLLLELPDTLVLVDSGLGLRDVADPHGRLGTVFLAMMAPELREEMTAVRQIQQLGYDARDVRHIVLTHLDCDQAGGLDDFPHASVHMLAGERDGALAQGSWLDRRRFRPPQWRRREQWHVYDAAGGDSWFGFACVRTLSGLPPQIALVPLAGHTLGHAGVAIDRGEDWLLHAGDAYFHHGEMDARPSCTPGLRLWQWLLDKDHRQRRDNQARLRALRQTHGQAVQMFCTHDAQEFERLAGRALGTPAATRASDWEDALPAMLSISPGALA
ncbi:MAG: MBL fold metallo-hydrolase [Rhodocyclaceae bacterium]